MFSALMVISGLVVICARNPVHSVLFLIFAFFNAAGLFILIGAEYIAMTLVIVYVGAVAVLFLFVVMMLNIDIATLRAGFLKYLPLGLGLGALIFVHIYFALSISEAYFPAPSKLAGEMTNTQALGNLLYTDYFFAFQGSGIILLVAMIGAILLTLSHTRDTKRQDICKQVKRTRDDAVQIVSVKSRQGVRDYD